VGVCGKRSWIRLQGELCLTVCRDDVPEARECSRRAIEIARRQAARSRELRAASILARLLVAEGQRGEARCTVASVYNELTAGLDTADLREAKAPLDTLARGQA
jgi:adenylate cyclase